MNKPALALLCLALVLPSAARAWEVPKDAETAQKAVKSVKAENKKNLSRLKGQADKPKAWLTYPYGSDGMTPSDEPSLDEVKEALKTKELYWQGVLDVMLAERDKIRAEIEQAKAAKDNQKHLALVKSLGKLMADFKVASYIREDIRRDGKILEAWNAKKPGIEVKGPETAKETFRRKAKVFAELKDGKVD
jgi:hypothetical protein